jgi:hypothetical protein
MYSSYHCWHSFHLSCQVPEVDLLNMESQSNQFFVVDLINMITVNGNCDIFPL